MLRFGDKVTYVGDSFTTLRDHAPHGVIIDAKVPQQYGYVVAFNKPGWWAVGCSESELVEGWVDDSDLC